MKKKAVIRSDKLKGCPFGLPIPTACKCAGKCINRMAPVKAAEGEDKQEKIAKANKLVYVYHKDGTECPYADKILEGFDKIDCDFADVGAGMSSTPFAGSPLYIQTFQGVGADGLNAFPLGWLSDNAESRNMFFGLFSYLGEDHQAELVKLAENQECESVLDDIIDFLRDPEDDEFEEIMQKIEGFLEDYKEKYNEERSDSGYLNEMARKWFGPRGVEG